MKVMNVAWDPFQGTWVVKAWNGLDYLGHIFEGTCSQCEQWIEDQKKGGNSEVPHLNGQGSVPDPQPRLDRGV